MGGSQSTRKISVENDNRIQVSQEAFDRIRQQKTQSQYTPQSPPQPQPTREAPKRDIHEEAYMASRIEQLKREHDKMKYIMNSEYEKTLKEADKLFKSANKVSASQVAPCQNEQAMMFQCYSNNPNKTLVCSNLVNEFSNCVCNSRIAALTSS